MINKYAKILKNFFIYMYGSTHYTRNTLTSISVRDCIYYFV